MHTYIPRAYMHICIHAHMHTCTYARARAHSECSPEWWVGTHPKPISLLVDCLLIDCRWTGRMPACTDGYLHGGIPTYMETGRPLPQVEHSAD